MNQEMLDELAELREMRQNYREFTVAVMGTLDQLRQTLEMLNPERPPPPKRKALSLPDADESWKRAKHYEAPIAFEAQSLEEELPAPAPPPHVEEAIALQEEQPIPPHVEEAIALEEEVQPAPPPPPHVEEAIVLEEVAIPVLKEGAQCPGYKQHRCTNLSPGRKWRSGRPNGWKLCAACLDLQNAFCRDRKRERKLAKLKNK